MINWIHPFSQSIELTRSIQSTQKSIKPIQINLITIKTTVQTSASPYSFAVFFLLLLDRERKWDACLNFFGLFFPNTFRLKICYPKNTVGFNPV